MDKVVISAAILDLCHRGHLELLKRLRAEAGKGWVVLILHSDQACYQIKGKIPIQSLEQRTNNAMITGYVDEVIPTHGTDPHQEIEQAVRKYRGRDMVFMRGDDNKDFPGKWAVEKHDIPIKYVPYTKGVSSSIIRKELECL